MSEPTDDWPCKFNESLELTRSRTDLSPGETIHKATGSPEEFEKETDFEFARGPLAAEDDDEVTDSKIRAFLDEKVLIFFTMLYG